MRDEYPLARTAWSKLYLRTDALDPRSPGVRKAR